MRSTLLQKGLVERSGAAALLLAGLLCAGPVDGSWADEPGAAGREVEPGADEAGGGELGQGEAAPGATGAKAVRPLSMTVELFPDVATRAVGQTIHVRVTLENHTGKPMTIPRLDGHGLEVSSVLLKAPKARLVSFSSEEPDASHGSDRVESLPEWLSREDFQVLPPGTTVVEKRIRPVLPGELRVAVFVFCADGFTQYDPRAGAMQLVTVDNGWTGVLEKRFSFVLADRAESAVGLRLEALATAAQDRAGAVESRVGSVVRLVREDHFFAAETLRGLAARLEPGPVRDAAVIGLLELAQRGSGVGAWADLVDFAGSSEQSAAVRYLLCERLWQMQDEWVQIEGAGGYSLGSDFRRRVGKLLEGNQSTPDMLLSVQADRLLQQSEEKNRPDRFVGE